MGNGDLSSNRKGVKDQRRRSLSKFKHADIVPHLSSQSPQFRLQKKLLFDVVPTTDRAVEPIVEPDEASSPGICYCQTCFDLGVWGGETCDSLEGLTGDIVFEFFEFLTQLELSKPEGEDGQGQTSSSGGMVEREMTDLVAAVPVVTTTTTTMTLIGPSFSGSTQTTFSATTSSYGEPLLHFRPDLLEGATVPSLLTPFGNELTTISEPDLVSLTVSDWESVQVPVPQQEEEVVAAASSFSWPEMTQQVNTASLEQQPQIPGPSRTATNRKYRPPRRTSLPPIIVNNQEISHLAWAKGYAQLKMGLGKASNALFDYFFTNDDIMKSTVSGRSGSTPLDPHKLDAIIQAVTWMKNNQADGLDPYNYRVEDAGELTTDELSAVKKVFVERRNERKRGLRKQQKKKEEGVDRGATKTRGGRRSSSSSSSSSTSSLPSDIKHIIKTLGNSSPKNSEDDDDKPGSSKRVKKM